MVPYYTIATLFTTLARRRHANFLQTFTVLLLTLEYGGGMVVPS